MHLKRFLACFLVFTPKRHIYITISKFGIFGRKKKIRKFLCDFGVVPDVRKYFKQYLKLHIAYKNIFHKYW